MGNRLHEKEVQRILADNLSRILAKRKLSVRKVADEIGMSNRTLQNVVNGTGRTQLDKLVAISCHLRVPLWQLLCPAPEDADFGEEVLHEILEGFATLPSTGKLQVQRTLKSEAALARFSNEGKTLS